MPRVHQEWDSPTVFLTRKDRAKRVDYKWLTVSARAVESLGEISGIK